MNAAYPPANLATSPTGTPSKRNARTQQPSNPSPMAVSSFYESLHDRLHQMAQTVLFQEEGGFTLFINMLPQDGNSNGEGRYLIYAGCRTQQNLLRHQYPEKKGESLEKVWKCLDNAIVELESASISYKFFNSNLYIDDFCYINSLSTYFSNFNTDAQEAEHSILKFYFNIDQDVFISIPLIGFGQLEGIVHIVFEKNLLYKVIGPDESTWRRLPRSFVVTLTKSFVLEHDGLYLEHAWAEPSPKNTAILQFIMEHSLSSKTYEDKQPLLPELRLSDYYKKHHHYLQKKIDVAQSIPSRLYQQYVVHAVTSILVDSYTHNISAHSLTALSWWFYQRAERLKNSPEIDSIQPFEFATDSSNNWPIREPDKFNQDFIIDYPNQLTREVASLLRFLMEKGAYWSGLTRDVSAGGKSSSLYSLLWRDFINNPLYVGTIAKTESIQHIKIKIYLYERETAEDQQGQTDIRQPLMKGSQGIFAGVDLTKMQPEQSTSTALFRENSSPFVYKGIGFEFLRPLLKQIRVFLPGGLVGKHAFFTMLENEIRNVKHFDAPNLKQAQKEGLTLSLGVQPCSLAGSIGDELYRLTIWLETPILLDNGQGENLVYGKERDLFGDLFTPQYAPRLGGTFQDKVCAGYLLNGVFSDVQRGDTSPQRDAAHDTPLHQYYYPWVRAVCSPPFHEEIADVHSSYGVNKLGPSDQPIQLPQTGYLKKMFYLWRGALLLRDWRPANRSNGLAQYDNPSRFGVIHVHKDTDYQKALSELRPHKGVVRIVQGNLPSLSELNDFVTSYKYWLAILLGKNQRYSLCFTDGENLLYYWVLDTNEKRPLLYFYDYMSFQEAEKDGLMPWVIETTPSQQVALAHGGQYSQPHNIGYRNHGIYRSYFIPPNSTPQRYDDAKMLELLEVMATCVCVFDNRIHSRISTNVENRIGTTLLREQLRLMAFPENAKDNNHATDAWLGILEEQDVNFVKNCHFLVIHLSYVEQIMRETRQETQETRSVVNDFITQHIEPLFGHRQNFFLVITTGRGRSEWWSQIDHKIDRHKRSYSSFTLFRPVEALLSAIEASIATGDDIELKYRIVKTLYGS